MLTELDLWRAGLPEDLKAPDLRLELATMAAHVKLSRLELAEAIVHLCGARDALMRMPAPVLKAARGKALEKAQEVMR